MIERGLTNANALEKIIVSFNWKGQGFDISAMVTTMNITESIHGDLQGSLEVTDDSGLIDNIILTGDEIINISFEYFELKIKHAFFFNGINHISMGEKTSSKTYSISLGSINEYISASNLVSKAYEDKSTNIIAKIFTEFFVFDEMIIRKESINNGRYIAPNISPKIAIERLRKKSYDENKSSLFIFQSLFLNGVTQLDSLYNMLKRDPVYDISPKNGFSDDVKKSPISNKIGTPAKIIINDNTNIIGTTSMGVKGSATQFVNLDTSSQSKDLFLGTSRASITSTLPIRNNMYSDNVNPIVSGANNNVINQANFSADGASVINATAYNTPGIPGLCVGHTVNLIVGEYSNTHNNSQKNKYSRKYANTYLVTGIDHHFSKGAYLQNIKLSKGTL